MGSGLIILIQCLSLDGVSWPVSRNDQVICTPGGTRSPTHPANAFASDDQPAQKASNSMPCVGDFPCQEHGFIVLNMCRRLIFQSYRPHRVGSSG
ncbi:hypothetical protein BJX65DRAFT_278758 [Aspergillus insuetus]